MAGNDKSRDGKLVSNEAHEIEYIHRQFPNSSHKQVEDAVAACKKQLGGSEDRTKIMECVKGKLK